MSGSNIKLCIVTPIRKLFEDEVDSVIIRTTEGDTGILPGHEAVTALLGYGVMKAVKNGEEILFSVLGGFAEIREDRVTVLSDAAERHDEIDKERALAAKERAERMIRNQEHDVDTKRAALALRRALVRIEASSYPLIGGKINIHS